MRLGLSFGAAVCILAALTCGMILREPPPAPVVLARVETYHPGPHWLHRRIVVSRAQTAPADPASLSEWRLSP